MFIESVLNSGESLYSVISVILDNLLIKNVLVLEFVFEIDYLKVEINVCFVKLMNCFNILEKIVFFIF